jgi:hypothetical protein
MTILFKILNLVEVVIQLNCRGETFEISGSDTTKNRKEPGILEEYQ